MYIYLCVHISLPSTFGCCCCGSTDGGTGLLTTAGAGGCGGVICCCCLGGCDGGVEVAGALTCLFEFFVI
jgi:hypothetical protein